MTVIRPNGISGVTSITSSGGVINFYRSDGTLGPELGINVNVNSGVSTFAALNVTGVLTYEDVTSVDSVGIITARSDLSIADKIIHTGDTNTAIRFPAADTVTVETGGSERLRIDSSGRLLVGTSSATKNADRSSGSTIALAGVTNYPSVVVTGYSSGNNDQGPLLDLQKSRGASDGSMTIVTDADRLGTLNFLGSDGTNFLRAASITGFVDGTPGSNDMPGRLVFFTTSDGASSPTERMRIDSAGRLLLNSGTDVRIELGTTGSTGTNNRNHIRGDGSSLKYNTCSGGLHIFEQNGAERMRITSGGDFGVGVSDATVLDDSAFREMIIGGATEGAAIHLQDVDGNVKFGAFTSDVSGAAFIRTITNHPMVFRTNNTERMRINAGNVLIGKTTAGIANAGFEYVNGASASAKFAMFTTSASTSVYVNRTTNDGTLISFQQDGTQEGTISVSGTTVSYNGALLSRWSQLSNGAERTEILRGSVLSNIDEMCEWGEEDNEQLNRMKVSDVEGDRNVSGVFQSWDDDDDTYTNDFYCAMTGDFVIRIAQGTTVVRGDLLMSAGDGTAKPQDDDIVRSKTIAKVTSTNVSTTYEDGSYCVPCVLMAC